MYMLSNILRETLSSPGCFLAGSKALTYCKPYSFQKSVKSISCWQNVNPSIECNVAKLVHILVNMQWLSKMNIMITHMQELMNNGVDERTISLWQQQQSQQTQMKYSIFFPTLNNSIECKIIISKCITGMGNYMVH